MSLPDDQMALLTEELVRDEGEVLHAYQDDRGYWTIGVGILIDARRGGGITQAESRYLLRNRIAAKEADLDHMLPWWRRLSPRRQRVLLNMCFNLGIDGLLKFRRFLEALRAGDWPEAAREMADSAWAEQVGERADRLIEMMKEG